MFNRSPGKPPSSALGAQLLKRERGRRTQGLTMIELIMFIIILSIGITGILSVFNITVAKSADPMIRKNMLSIAEALLEEVELMPFTYCDPSITADPSQTWTAATSTAACAIAQGLGPGNGEVRVSTTNSFNNVGDYAAASGNGAGSVTGLGDTTHSITDISGNSSAPLGYTATIGLTAEALGPATSQITSTSAAATLNVVRITVTVSYSGNSVVLEGYRARYFPNNLAW